jgi:predicted transcriptional regulator
MLSPKKDALRIIASLPDVVTLDEILREIAFARMIARGLEDVKQGRVISMEEVKRRVQSWKQSS